MEEGQNNTSSTQGQKQQNYVDDMFLELYDLAMAEQEQYEHENIIDTNDGDITS
jgi:hypothetical protein